jgi:hypothetical protein
MEKYESLHHRELAHTRIYNVNLLERVSLDEELPTILRTIGWGKLYNEPHQGLHLLTLETFPLGCSFPSNPLLLLKIFKINVLEVLRQIGLYMTTDRLETNNITQNKSNRTANKVISII